MDLGDLLLTPLYLLILYGLARLFRPKGHLPKLNTWYFTAFWLKMFACIAFSLYFVYVYPADVAHLYFPEANTLYKRILQDPGNVQYLFKSGTEYDFTFIENTDNRGYFYSEANVIVIKLGAVANFLSFGKFLPVNLLFAGLGFAGLWRLFLFFYLQKPRLHGAIAACILFLPSVVFWTSGLSKDTLCLAALGFISLSFYRVIFLRRMVFQNTILFLLFSLLLGAVKVYILASYLPFLFLYAVLSTIERHPVFLMRMVLAPAFVAMSMLVSVLLLIQFEDALGKYALQEVTSSIAQLNESFQERTGNADAASNFNLGVQFDPTLGGLVRAAPFAVVATFFRPFIWEVDKVSQLLAALESVILILLTVYVLFKSRIYRFFVVLFTNPLVMYCFFFAVVFGVFVGSSTVNFGTLVRYKVPCLPFFSLSLVFILDQLRNARAPRQNQRYSLAMPMADSVPS